MKLLSLCWFFLYLFSACHRLEEPLESAGALSDAPVFETIVQGPESQIIYEEEKIEPAAKKPEAKPEFLDIPPPLLNLPPPLLPILPEDDFGSFPHKGLGGFFCGNGIKQGKEQCDDGNSVNEDGCNNLCGLPVCGNGVKDWGEECDDIPDATPPTGTTIITGTSKGCNLRCLIIRCGNGFVDTGTGEECDDGNLKNGDGCSDCCKFECPASL